MSVLDVSLPVAAQPSTDSLVGLTKRAESLGYNRVWVPKTWGPDVVTVLTTLAERTETVGIGGSMMSVYSRSPVIIGQTATTLQEVSGGRFRLGVPFDRPLRRMRETIEITKQLLSGETVEYDGECFELSGFRLLCEPPTVPQIDAAGMGPKSVELAGRFADGWHALMLTPEGVNDRLADLRRGAELAGRDPSTLRTTLLLTCCVDTDGARARTLVKRHLAFYVGGMGPIYRDVLARQGYEDTATEIHDQWTAGNKDQAVNAVDDELLDRLAVAGTPDVARDRLAAFTAIDHVDAVAVSFPRAAPPEDIDTTLAALAP